LSFEVALHVAWRSTEHKNESRVSLQLIFEVALHLRRTEHTKIGGAGSILPSKLSTQSFSYIFTRLYRQM